MFPKLFAACLAILLTLPLAWAESDATTVKRAILRAGPDKASASISTLAPGTAMTVISSEPPFIQVQLSSGKTGWIAEHLVNRTVETVAAPPAPAANAAADSAAPAALPAANSAATTGNNSAVPAPAPAAAPEESGDLPLWLVGMILIGGCLAGFAAGYAYRESYYRKKLHGLRV